AATSPTMGAGLISIIFFFSSRRRHTRWPRDWSSDVCSSDLFGVPPLVAVDVPPHAASGPASITPPANTPALISRRRRVSELVLRSPGRSIGVSAIDFLLLGLRRLPKTTQSAIAGPSPPLSARFPAR